MDTFIARMIKAALLNKALYEEVEADRSAMVQALLVVVLSSIAGTIGHPQLTGLGEIIKGILINLSIWFLWAAIALTIGTTILKGPDTRADMGEMLRTLGFASAPGIIRVLGFIPLIGWLFHLIAGIWMLIAMVIAVRQALDYHSTERAVAVCLIGFIPYIIIYWILF